MALAIQVIGHPKKTTPISWKIGTLPRIHTIRKPHQQHTITIIGTVVIPAPRTMPARACDSARKI